MGSELNRENRGINTPDILQAVNLQFGIDNTSLGKRQHREGICGMELRRDIVGNVRVDRIVSSDSRTGGNFAGENTTQWGGSCKCSSELDTLPQQLYIGPMRQVLRVNRRVIEGIVGGDVQPSLTEWMLKGELNGDRLITAPEVPGSVQQQLDLADGAHEDILGVSFVESLVALDNTWILAGNELGYGVVEVGENLLLEI